MHKLITTTDTPVRVKRHRHPPAIKEEMQRQIAQYLEAGILRPSECPYSSMMWVVPKITVGNSYPLSLTTDVIEAIASAKYITAIDLKTGFYQIPMDPEDARKTAFAETYGHYEYTRMGMGLLNAPATFQALMDLVLSGLQGVELYVYLDNIIVFAIRPDPKKIEAVRNFPVPTNKKKIKQFLGLVGYYRRFVKDLTKIAHPLSKLLREKDNNGKQPFTWGD